MAGGNGPNNGGRVTTQEFYQALLDNKDEMAEMERRIMAELKGVPTQVDTNKEEIKLLRNSSNAKDWGLLLTGVVGNVIAAVIGSRQ